MSAPSPRIFVYAVLLPHPTEHRVLVQREGDGWVLPYWKTTQRHFWAAADYVNRTVRERLGVEVTTLRCLPHNPEPVDGPIRRTYDWSDGCVAQPFFALLPFLTFRGEQLPGGSEAHGRLIRAYLEAWTDFAPLDRLQNAFERSQTLAALHQAVSYHRILTGVESRNSPR